jgi:hypothetical protein
MVRHYAGQLNRGCAPYDHDCRLERIGKFVADHMNYLPDPVGVEAIGLASWHLKNIRVGGQTDGDCDDAAVLAGTLARCVGRPVRLHVASFLPDRRLHHIWAEARGRDRWIQLDPFRSERFNRPETRTLLIEV